MAWTSISRRLSCRAASGFGVIEVVLGLFLALCLALAVAPLLTSLQRTGVEQADRSVQAVQARVAFGRFERDMRLAGGSGCPFPTSGALLEAGVSRVILLVPSEVDSTPIIVEWEITGSNLMRRWGPCPSTRPGVFTTSLFVDNKTMLEGVRTGSHLSYLIGERIVVAPLARAELAAVDKVVLELWAAPSGLSSPAIIRTTGRVGR